MSVTCPVTCLKLIRDRMTERNRTQQRKKGCLWGYEQPAEYRFVFAGVRYGKDHLFLHDHPLHRLSAYRPTTELCGIGESHSALSQRRRRSTWRRSTAGIPTSCN
ncbi:hypothetical protein DPEC_G00009220 [Dallia pectoralis]|uniref:Uncharacterized protein n=1 Tax=Dallia pectoralis TaxID=75939 RepID=A0ACC2HMD6_DALPE|nr:hypothetical protein DPEC_G00009220 [Dallia pectoralis]